jgi:hypothetical protein
MRKQFNKIWARRCTQFFLLSLDRLDEGIMFLVFARKLTVKTSYCMLRCPTLLGVSLSPLIVGQLTARRLHSSLRALGSVCRPRVHVQRRIIWGRWIGRVIVEECVGLNVIVRVRMAENSLRHVMVAVEA